MHSQILVIGGGTAGITVAARLLKLNPKLGVSIIEPSDKHYYQPLWTFVGAGILRKEKTERPEANFIPKRAKWIRDSVVAFEPESNKVLTSSGTTIEYDYLVVAPGIQIHWDAIKGLSDALGRDGVCSNYSYKYVDKTWEMIKNFKGGHALFTFPSTPVKCAGAPQKIMYLAENYFRKKGVRQKTEVEFISAGKSIFGVAKYAESLSKIIAKRNIKTCYQHDLIEIKSATKEAVFRNLETKELKTVHYDLIHVTPPMGAPNFVKNSPLANEAGWVDVHRETLQHVRYKNIFSLGDASSLPTSRTGAAIRKQAPVLVRNLLALMAGLPLKAKYDGYTSCPLVTQYGRVILAEFDYSGTPRESFPFDQSKERRSMYLLKRYFLPLLYWKGMLRGRA